MLCNIEGNISTIFPLALPLISPFQIIQNQVIHQNKIVLKKYLLETEEIQYYFYLLNIHLSNMLTVLLDPLKIVIGAIMSVMDWFLGLIYTGHSIK